MRIIYFIIAILLLTGCTTEQQVQSTGPASLQLVPATYYSRFPKYKGYRYFPSPKRKLVIEKEIKSEIGYETIEDPILLNRIDKLQDQIDSLKNELINNQNNKK